MGLRARAGALLVRAGNLALDAVRALLFASTDRRAPRSILVLRFGAIGDFVVALPALHLLRKHYPGAKIVLLTASSLNRHWRHRVTVRGGAIIADGLFDEKIVLRGPDLNNWRQLAETRRRIRRWDPDICVFLPFSGEPFRSRLMKMLGLRFLGCRKNLYGYHAASSLGIFRQAQYEAGVHDHQVTAALKAVGELGIKDDEIRFDIQVSCEDVRLVDQWWTQHGLHQGEAPIAICPSSKEKVKCWPVDHFEELGLQLLEVPSVRIVLVGGTEDQPSANLLVDAWGERAVSFVGKTSLLQTAEILRRCKLFIGVDSGPAHLAAAMGRPVVGIFASVVFPVLWKPWGKQSTIIRHSVPCEFCFTTTGMCPTGTMDCIKGIRVEDVLQAVRRIIDARQTGESHSVTFVRPGSGNFDRNRTVKQPGRAVDL